ncbi:hypothetical protein, conserved [Babesia ovata]|uniref:Circumsporozoite protein n=1 Tax=Babesia ovata TaxID=189622 RepID=A0A2H6KIU6_9APIC|nr:uncharacterized protein BOVATA_043990 [Babesia ovata]GBE62906.1 hypothetical protein, conserved [Babesia ovata]
MANTSLTERQNQLKCPAKLFPSESADSSGQPLNYCDHLTSQIKKLKNSNNPNENKLNKLQYDLSSHQSEVHNNTSKRDSALKDIHSRMVSLAELSGKLGQFIGQSDEVTTAINDGIDAIIDSDDDFKSLKNSPSSTALSPPAVSAGLIKSDELEQKIKSYEALKKPLEERQNDKISPLSSEDSRLLSSHQSKLQSLQRLKSLNDSLNSLSKQSDDACKNLLNNLCTGLEKFLGYEKGNYTGEGIVYSDLDRLCDGVMAFLHSVLQDVHDKQPYKVGKDYLNENVVKLVERYLCQGHDGFKRVIVNVAAGVGRYNREVERSNESVKTIITGMQENMKSLQNEVSGILKDHSDAGDDQDFSKAVKKVDDSLAECLRHADTFENQLHNSHNNILDLNPNIRDRILKAKSCIVHERSRLNKLYTKKWEDLFSMEAKIGEVLEHLRSHVKGEIDDKINKLVGELKKLVQDIVEKLRHINITLMEYVMELNKWMHETKGFIDGVMQKEVNRIVKKEVGDGNIFDINQKAKELGEKGEEIYQHLKWAKERVENFNKDAQAKLNLLNEALKLDLNEVKNAINSGIREYINGKLLNDIKIKVGNIKGNSNSGLVQTLEEIKKWAETFNGKQVIGEKVDQWVKGILANNAVVKGTWEKYVQYVQQHQSTFKVQEYGNLDGNGVREELIGVIVDQIKEAFNKGRLIIIYEPFHVDENEGIAETVKKMKQVCDGFAKQLEDKLKDQGVALDIAREIAQKIEQEVTSPSPTLPPTPKKSPLTNVVYYTLYQLLGAARQNSADFEWLIGINSKDANIKNVDKALEVATGLDRDLRTATEPGIPGSIVEPGKAFTLTDKVDGRILGILEEKLPGVGGTSGSQVDLEASKLFAGYVGGGPGKPGKKRLLEEAIDEIKNDVTEAFNTYVKDKYVKSKEALEKDPENKGELHDLYTQITAKLYKLIDEFAETGIGVKQTMELLKSGKINTDFNRIKNDIKNLRKVKLVGAIQDTEHVLKYAETLRVQTISDLKNYVDSKVKDAKKALTQHARKDYVSTIQLMLKQFADKVRSELYELPEAIENDKLIGFKGFMKAFQGFENGEENIKRLQDVKEENDVKYISSGFLGFFAALNHYLGKEIKRSHEQNNLQKNPNPLDPETVYTTRLTNAFTALSNLLQHITKTNKYDHSLPGLLDKLSEAVNKLIPKDFENPNTPILDAIRSGFAKFVDELRKVYISKYDGADAIDVWVEPDTTKKPLADDSSVDNTILTDDGRNGAKVFCTIIKIICDDLTELHKQCSTGAAWWGRTIYESNGAKGNPLGDFLRSRGYRVPTSKTNQDGELQRSPKMNGRHIHHHLNVYIPDAYYNQHLKECKPNDRRTHFNVVDIIRCMFTHVNEFYDVCHLPAPSSKKHPTSIYDMLTWLCGLTYNPVYDAIKLDGFAQLFDKPEKPASEDSDSTEPVLLVEDDASLPAYPETITAMGLSDTLSAVCHHAYETLTAILGHGHSGGIYACEFNINAQGFVYPADFNTLICMIFNILKLLHQQLYFLYTQCCYSTKLGGWLDCHYGRHVGGSNWNCNDFQCPKQDCDQKHNQTCNQTADQKAIQTPDQHYDCGVKSPLQSFLEDGLVGFLPHPVTSTRGKLECPVKSHFSIPCKAPMGFTDISQIASHVKNGQYLKRALSEYCGTASSPLTKLCSQLNCLLPTAPKSLGDMFAFYFSFLNDWCGKNPELMKHREIAYNLAVKEANFNSSLTGLMDCSELFKSTVHASYAPKTGASNYTAYHHKGDLYSIYSPADTCYTANTKCGAYASPLSMDIYSSFSSKHKALYMSWMVYVTEALFNLFCGLNKECNGNCGSQTSKCRITGCVKGICKVADSGVLAKNQMAIYANVVSPLVAVAPVPAAHRRRPPRRPEDTLTPEVTFQPPHRRAVAPRRRTRQGTQQRQVLLTMIVPSPTHPTTHSPTHSPNHPLTHPLTHQLTHSTTHPLTHSLTHSPTHPLNHSPTHSLIHSHTQPLNHPLNHSPTHSPTHPLTHSTTHLLTTQPLNHSTTHSTTQPPTQPLNHSPTHPLTHSLTQPLTHSPTHSTTHPLTQPLTHSLSHPPTHSPTHLITHSPTHPLTQPLTQPPTHSPPPSLVASLPPSPPSSPPPSASLTQNPHFPPSPSTSEIALPQPIFPLHRPLSPLHFHHPVHPPPSLPPSPKIAFLQTPPNRPQNNPFHPLFTPFNSPLIHLQSNYNNHYNEVHYLTEDARNGALDDIDARRISLGTLAGQLSGFIGGSEEVKNAIVKGLHSNVNELVRLLKASCGDKGCCNEAVKFSDKLLKNLQNKFNEVDKIETKIDGLNKEIAEKRKAPVGAPLGSVSEIQRLTKEIKQHKDTIFSQSSPLKDQITSVIEAVQSKITALDSKKKKVVDAQRQVNDLKKEIDAKQNNDVQLEDLKNKLNELEKKLNEAKNNFPEKESKSLDAHQKSMSSLRSLQTLCQHCKDVKNNESKTPKNILESLCGGLEKFLGYQDGNYTGEGIVYSDLDRLCDGVMAFLHGVLETVKDDESVTTYDKDRDKNITNTIKELNDSVGQGRKAFPEAVHQVSEWLKKHGAQVDQKIKNVRDPLNNLLTGPDDNGFKKIPQLIQDIQGMQGQEYDEVSGTGGKLHKWVNDVSGLPKKTEEALKALKSLDNKLRNNLDPHVSLLHNAVETFRVNTVEDHKGLTSITGDVKKHIETLQTQVLQVATSEERTCREALQGEFLEKVQGPINEVKRDLEGVDDALDLWINEAEKVVKAVIKKAEKVWEALKPEGSDDVHIIALNIKKLEESKAEIDTVKGKISTEIGMLDTWRTASQGAVGAAMLKCNDIMDKVNGEKDMSIRKSAGNIKEKAQKLLDAYDQARRGLKALVSSSKQKVTHLETNLKTNLKTLKDAISRGVEDYIRRLGDGILSGIDNAGRNTYGTQGVTGLYLQLDKETELYKLLQEAGNKKTGLAVRLDAALKTLYSMHGTLKHYSAEFSRTINKDIKSAFEKKLPDQSDSDGQPTRVELTHLSNYQQDKLAIEQEFQKVGDDTLAHFSTSITQSHHKELEALQDSFRDITGGLTAISKLLANPNGMAPDKDDGVKDYLRDLTNMINRRDGDLKLTAKNLQNTTVRGLTNIHSELTKFNNQVPNHTYKIKSANEAIKLELIALQGVLQGSSGSDVIKSLEDLLNTGIYGTGDWKKGEDIKALQKIQTTLSGIIGDYRKQENTLIKITEDANMFYTKTIETKVSACVKQITNKLKELVPKKIAAIRNSALANFAKSKEAELENLKRRVTEKNEAIRKLIDTDRRNGVKGLIEKLCGGALQNTDDNLLLRLKSAVTAGTIVTLRVTKTQHEATRLSDTSEAFNNYLTPIFKYVEEQAKTVLPPERPLMPPPKKGNAQSSQIAGLQSTIDSLLQFLKNSNRFDFRFQNNLDTVKDALSRLISPTFSGYQNAILLDTVKNGVTSLLGELDKVYMNTYDGALSVDWTHDIVNSERCAKVFSSILSTLREELEMLIDECSADWKTHTLCETNGDKDNPLGQFLKRSGYTVAKKQDSKEGELKLPINDFTGKKIHDNLKAPTSDGYTLLGTLESLINNLNWYYQVGHHKHIPSPRTPCNIYEMLTWCCGLQYNSVYSNLVKYCDEYDTNDTDKTPDHDFKKRLSDAVDYSLSDLCTYSRKILTTIVGHGNSHTMYACEYSNNALNLKYPASGEDCLRTLLDILRRMLPTLRYLRSQCKRGTEHHGWSNCQYGGDISPVNQPCIAHPTDKPNGQPKCQPNCQSTSKANCQSTCQPTSPLMSYLNDCLPGHLPHQLSSIGCRATCTTCPKSPPGTPCLTPLGFRRFSGSTRTGNVLCRVLTKFFSSANLSPLFCIAPKPPSTLPEHLSFTLTLVNGWRNIATDPYEPRIHASIKDTSIQLYAEPTVLTNAIIHAYGSGSAEHTDCTHPHLTHLTTIGFCNTKGNRIERAPYLQSLCRDAYHDLVKKHANLYLSWAIYLPWTFWDLLNHLYNTFCSIVCEDYGCRSCLRGGICKRGQHGLVVSEEGKPDKPHCLCSSLVQCKGVPPTLYQYGLSFGAVSRLDNIASPKKCSDFCSQLKQVLKSEYFKTLFEKCDEFLWIIRTPFSYLLLALWSLSLLYLLHIAVVRLDVLRIRSHLRSPSSHRIAAQSLLAAARVKALANVKYFSP